MNLKLINFGQKLERFVLLQRPGLLKIMIIYLCSWL